MGLKQFMHLKPYTDRNLHDNHQITLDNFDPVTFQLFKKTRNKNQPIVGMFGQHFLGNSILSPCVYH